MEQSKIKMLAIAPYIELKKRLETAVVRFPEISADIFIGDMDDGLKVYKQHSHEGYDIILSRGGTAEMLSRNADIPVIDIEISTYDILRCIKLAENFSGKYAILSFPTVVRNVRTLCDLLRYNIDIYTWENVEDIAPQLQMLRSMNIEMVICDMIVSTQAQQYGMNSILLTSGADSIDDAIQRAIRLSETWNRQKLHKSFFSSLLMHQNEEIIVYDRSNSICFSTLHSMSIDAIQPLINRCMLQHAKEEETVLTQAIDNRLLCIRCVNIEYSDGQYTALFLSQKDTPLRFGNKSIRYYRYDEIMRLFIPNCQFYNTKSAEGVISFDELNNSRLPVLLIGEEGTGKRFVASNTYCSSSLKRRPFVDIDVSALTEREYKNLVSNPDSPLYERDATFYIHELNKLSETALENYIEIFTSTDFCRRNHVFLSFTIQRNQPLNPGLSSLSERLCCVKITLPALHERTDEISDFACLDIASLNLDLGKQVVGFDQDAMELLRQYSWPGNIPQFRRIIRQIMVGTPAQISYIPRHIVQSVLNAEVRTSPATEDNAQYIVPEGKNLYEMNCEIAQIVLKQCGGIQSAAAKKLGISRTTLWRMLHK